MTEGCYNYQQRWWIGDISGMSFFRGLNMQAPWKREQASPYCDETSFTELWWFPLGRHEGIMAILLSYTVKIGWSINWWSMSKFNSPVPFFFVHDFIHHLFCSLIGFSGESGIIAALQSESFIHKPTRRWRKHGVIGRSHPHTKRHGPWNLVH